MLLLGHRQDEKGISDALTVLQKREILQSIALGLMRNQTRELRLQVWTSLITEKLRNIGNQTTSADFLKDIENKSGLLIEREKGIYEFTHKSFQEYLAAVEIKDRQQQQVEMLVSEIENEWWAENY